MTYNTKPRKPLRKAQRQAFLLANGSVCYYCGRPILDDLWDDEHVLARELGGSDEMENRKPIHRHPCHKIKTALDRKLIAKGNRIIRERGPVEQRRKRTSIPQPKVHQWPQGQKLKSRGFSKLPPRSG